MATCMMRRSAALVMALLLALCIASPALAEIGCSWDAATHFAESGPAAEHDEDQGGGEAERDSHCAFAHGHGDLARAVSEPAAPAPLLNFAPPRSAAFISSLPTGPDRPPRG